MLSLAHDLSAFAAKGAGEPYRAAAVERAMKVQEIVVRAMSKRITCWQGARGFNEAREV